MGGLVMETAIPYSPWLQLCAAEGLNLLERVKNAPVLQALHNLAKEYLDSLRFVEQKAEDLPAGVVRLS